MIVSRPSCSVLCHREQVLRSDEVTWVEWLLWAPLSVILCGPAWVLSAVVIVIARVLSSLPLGGENPEENHRSMDWINGVKSQLTTFFDTIENFVDPEESQLSGLCLRGLGGGGKHHQKNPRIMMREWKGTWNSSPLLLRIAQRLVLGGHLLVPLPTDQTHAPELQKFPTVCKVVFQVLWIIACVAILTWSYIFWVVMQLSLVFAVCPPVRWCGCRKKKKKKKKGGGPVFPVTFGSLTAEF